jgi:hypothetical protein
VPPINDKNSPITRALLTEVRQRVLYLLEQGTPDVHQLGWLYNYVVERQLAQRAGFKDAADFFTQEVKVISPATLAVYGAISREATELARAQPGVRVPMLFEALRTSRFSTRPAA